MNRLHILTLYLLLVSTAYGYTPTVHDIPVTRDLSGAELPTRQEYLAQFPESDLTLYDVRRPELGRDEDGTVVLVVNHQLLADHEESFQQYIDDLSAEGYEVVTIDIEGGTPQELKDIVIEEGGDNLIGTVMAGELPLPWFEMFEYFDDEEEPDNPRLHEFPVDLFFMDIDGEWQDTSGNDIYDVHQGNWQPDIWFGRLPGYNLSRIDEDELIESYLDKVHRYRTGEMEMPHRTINFVDDDWAMWADEWGDDMRLAYGGLFEESHPETTSATRYRHHLNEELYEMLQVCVHSGADTHLFRINDNHSNDYFRFSDLRDETTPNTMFYNLFACSAMNLERNLCLGALYALGGEYGLGAVGSTKTGGMLYFDDYYRRLGDGLNFGESLRLWLTDNLIEEGHENWSKSWFFGMTHFGDPTLRIRRGLRIVGFEFDDLESGDDDGKIDISERGILSLKVANQSQTDYTDLTVSVSSLMEFVQIHFIDNEAHIDRINSGDTVEVEISSIRNWGNYYQIHPDNYLADIGVEMSTGEGEDWNDMVKLPIHAPRVTPVLFSTEEIAGNGDGWVGNDERGLLSIQFTNIGGDDLHGTSRVHLASLDEQFSRVDTLGYGLLSPFAVNDFGTMLNYQYSINQINERSSAFVRYFVRADSILGGEIPIGSGVLMLPLSNESELNDSFDSEPVWINHYSATSGFLDAWRWGEDAGDQSGGIAFGAPDSGLYPPRTDAVFELPMMLFDDDAVLEFRHKMGVEENYDGGVIEFDRGDGWQRAEPIGGYNGFSVENGNYPGGACWNGVFDWTDVDVPIGGPAGALRIRFRFSSDNGIEMEGWFIDDVKVSGTPLEAESKPNIVHKFELTSAYPNPFNSQVRINYTLPMASDITLNVFDLTGRMVATLTDGRQTAGMQSVVWNGSDLPSGVYIVKLAGLDQVMNKKIVLIK